MAQVGYGRDSVPKWDGVALVVSSLLIERARPDAERFGCPIVLVAPDPVRHERASLSSLLDSLEAVGASSVE